MQNSTTKKTLVPKEHGAWGIWLVSYLIGIGIAERMNPNSLLLFHTALFLFLARVPLSLFVRQIRTEDLLIKIYVYTGLTLVSGILLLVRSRSWELLLLGGIALSLMILHLWLTQRREERTVLGELVGIAGLTLTGPGAYLAAGTSSILYEKAALLWLLCFAYFSEPVFYVKMLVTAKAAKGQKLDWTDKLRLGRDAGIYHTIVLISVYLLLVTKGMSVLILIPFVFTCLKVFWGISRLGEKSVSFKSVGWQEVAYSLLFGSFVVLAFI